MSRIGRASAQTMASRMTVSSLSCRVSPDVDQFVEPEIRHRPSTITILRCMIPATWYPTGTPPAIDPSPSRWTAGAARPGPTPTALIARDCGQSPATSTRCPDPPDLRPEVASTEHAGVAQWQSLCFPSRLRGFDSRHPLRVAPRPCDAQNRRIAQLSG